jgi:hypothetical protein
VRQVVLGEEVDEQRAAHGLVHRRLRLVPHLAGLEVPAEAPRHELVGEPLLGVAEVRSRRLLGDRAELLEQGDVSVHGHAAILPTSR